MKKFFLIDIPIYDVHLAVSIGQSDKEILLSCGKKIPNLSEKEIEYIGKKFQDTSSNGRTTALSYVGPYIIRLKYSPKTAKGAGVLSHEALHMVRWCLESRGMRLCDKSEEAYNYLLGYVVTEIHKRL